MNLYTDALVNQIYEIYKSPNERVHRHKQTCEKYQICKYFVFVPSARIVALLKRRLRKTKMVKYRWRPDCSEVFTVVGKNPSTLLRSMNSERYSVFQFHRDLVSELEARGV